MKIKYLLLLFPVLFAPCCYNKSKDTLPDKASRIRKTIEQTTINWGAGIGLHLLPSDTTYTIDSIMRLPSLTVDVFVTKTNMFPNNNLFIIYDYENNTIHFIPMLYACMWANSLAKDGMFSVLLDFNDELEGLERFLNHKKPDLNNGQIVKSLQDLINIYFSTYRQVYSETTVFIPIDSLSEDSVKLVRPKNIKIAIMDYENHVKQFFLSLKRSPLKKQGKLVAFATIHGDEVIIIRKSTTEDFIGKYPYRVCHYSF